MIWIVTLFPEYFKPLLECGIVGQKLQGLRGLTPKINLIQLRDYATNKYANVDDKPFGGMPGMILKADILKSAIDDIKSKTSNPLHVILPNPGGTTWDQSQALRVSQLLYSQNNKDLVFICGRYEGIDQRFIDLFCDEEFSLGDFIVSGGEIPTLAMIDSIIRLIPETLGNKDSLREESFQNNLLEGPHYTRPQIFENIPVPPILLSGHHQKILDFQLQQSEMRTKNRRMDLWIKYEQQRSKT